jgi:epoxyqueuosine reductase
MLAKLDDAAFRTFFAGSPIKRIGRARFLRNVLIAIGNSGSPALTTDVERLLDDPAPLIRGAAVWALGRLAPEQAKAWVARALASETDADVRNEWARIANGRQQSPTAL